MEKEVGKITFTETDDGFRVEVTGKSLKEMCSCGCIPMFAGGGMKMSECCPPEEDKK
jgi:hypothetical protein